MKMFNLRPLCLATLASGTLFLASCDKTRDPAVFDSITSAEDSGVADTVMVGCL